MPGKPEWWQCPRCKGHGTLEYFEHESLVVKIPKRSKEQIRDLKRLLRESSNIPWL